MSKNTGGPAFPVIPPLSGDVSASGYPYPDEGMTLRDYFAAKAMQGWLSNPNPDDTLMPEVAAFAYRMADAMLAERENSADGGASALTDVLERMRARADNAYCDYNGQLRREECLGWEIKVERGKFGEAELKAHCTAAEKLGRHRALHEAANMLADVLRSNSK